MFVWTVRHLQLKRACLSIRELGLKTNIGKQAPSPLAAKRSAWLRKSDFRRPKSILTSPCASCKMQWNTTELSHIARSYNFRLVPIGWICKKHLAPFSKDADGRQPYACPEKIPCLQAVCARCLGQPPACDPELTAISNSNPGDPTIRATRRITFGFGNSAHSANPGEDPPSGVPIGFSRGIYCSTNPSGATVRISGPRPASGCPRFATNSAQCRTRRTANAWSEANACSPDRTSSRRAISTIAANSARSS